MRHVLRRCDTGIGGLSVEFLDSYQQGPVVQFLCMCCGLLFSPHAGIVLLCDRCQKMAQLGFLLRGYRYEFDSHLHATPLYQFRIHARPSLRRCGITLPRAVPACGGPHHVHHHLVDIPIYHVPIQNIPEGMTSPRYCHHRSWPSPTSSDSKEQQL